MEKKKRKYSRTDRLILGIGFTILGLCTFYCDSNYICSTCIFYGSYCFE